MEVTNDVHVIQISKKYVLDNYNADFRYYRKEILEMYEILEPFNMFCAE